MQKTKVAVFISSTIGTETVTQQVNGHYYDDGSGRYYLRYEEQDAALGATRTTVRWQPGEIRVIRHGGVQSEQTFRPGQRLFGSYGFTQEEMILECDTKSLAASATLPGQLAWSYDLYVDGELTDSFQICLNIEEREQS